MDYSLLEWRADSPRHAVPRLIDIYSGHAGIVYDLEYSPRHDLLASAGEDGVIRLWVEGSREPDLVNTHHDVPVRCIAWSPDGELLATGSHDHTIRLWRTPARRPLALVTVLRGHSHAITDLSWRHKQLASTSYDGTVRIWDVPREEPSRVIDLGRSVTQVIWRSATSIICGCTDTFLRICEIDSDRLNIKLVKRETGRGGTASLASSADVTVFAAGACSASVSIHSAMTGHRMFDIWADHDFALFNPEVGCLRFASSGDSKELLAIRCGHVVSLWRWDKNQFLASWHGEQRGRSKPFAGVGGLAFNRDGTRMAVRHDESNDIFIWNLSDLRAQLAAAKNVASATQHPDWLRVFLCHASEDKARVARYYGRLQAIGVRPWLDARDLTPGTKWHDEIRKAVDNADVIVVFLSRHSTLKEGFVQREITWALDLAEEKLTSSPYLIPALLEECDLPERLKSWQAVRLHKTNGFRMLTTALGERARHLGRALVHELAKRRGGV